jgi:hypothetical protein
LGFEPSEFLALLQHHFSDELKRLRGQAPKWRCYDCKRWIPREELPMKCSECSGAPERVKRHRYSKVARKLVMNDAMICKHCVDKHDHLRQMVLDTMFQAYQHGLEKRLTMEAMGKFARGEMVQ